MAHIHLIGIGGSGLSAIARFLLEQGHTVTGSDRALSPLALELRRLGVQVFEGHAATHIAGADYVVRSSAIPDDNPEVQASLAAGIPVYKRANFLGQLMGDKVGIAIAGTHGKTTTTGMLSWVLYALGADPSFIVGGVLQNLGINAHAGQGRAFVIEADEYDRMFLGLQPHYAIVTNIEHDHPDCFPTPADFHAAFSEFMKLIPAEGALIACGEDRGTSELMEEARRLRKRVIGYRIAENQRTEAGEWVLAQNVMANKQGGFTFNALIRLAGHATYISGVQLRVPGLHNVRNALAVLAVVGLLGLDIKAAGHALGEFQGTARRFELKGEAKGVIVIDDYAHHPTEIRATLDAARARYPSRRLVVVWQPHTFSRTRTLFDEFVVSFGEADEVIVSEIYAAREPQEDFSAQQVVQAMYHRAARFIPTLPEIRNYLLAHLKPGDVLLVLSAGDADWVSAEVLARLKESEANNG
ncbi:MAG: UDP-N-acetylmuramate--L-alanine ligase [Anaerolineae bacterium]|nr:MAG: UDP-N-acetylmuramate--L-alanine ligase [Anaerolineae bacterium]